MISCGTNQNNIIESGPENNRKRYFFALDGWRFWAALIIVLHHSVHMPYFVQKTDFAFWLYTFSMTFFFMLSGFVAANSINNRQWDFNSTLNYYVARLIRIWPCHFLILLIILVMPFTVRSAGPFAANLFLLQSWFPWQSFYFSYNVPSWYLSSLMAIYLMMPLFVRYFKTCLCFSLILPVCLFFIVPDNYHTYFFYISPLSNMFKFLAGILVHQFVSYRLRSSSSETLSGKHFFLWSILEIALAAAVFVLAWNSGSLYGFLGKYLNPGCCTWIVNNYLVPLMAVFLVVFSLEKGMVSRLLSSRFSLSLGKISFVLFLWHVIIRQIIEYYDLFHHIPMKWRLLLFVGTAVILSFPLEYCINSPIIRRLSSFHKKHPLCLAGLRPYAPLTPAIGAVVLYLGCVIPRTADYTPFIFSTMKSVCDNAIPDQVKIYPNNQLLLHPGQKPTSAIFQLNRCIDKFSCNLQMHYEKGDVIVNFYLDDRLVKSIHVTGKDLFRKIVLSCANAGQLRIEVDKNGNMTCDGMVLNSVSFNGCSN